MEEGESFSECQSSRKYHGTYVCVKHSLYDFMQESAIVKTAIVTNFIFQGDSGGPLSCSHDGRSNWTVVSVVIWGDGCARIQRPGIYTNVQHYISWIAETIGNVVSSQSVPGIIG